VCYTPVQRRREGKRLMHITFLGATVAFILFMLVTGSIALFAYKYKPRSITKLSPEAYDEKMAEIERQRLFAIEHATSQEGIDRANAALDSIMSLRSFLAIRFMLSAWMKMSCGFWPTFCTRLAVILKSRAGSILRKYSKHYLTYPGILRISRIPQTRQVQYTLRRSNGYSNNRAQRTCLCSSPF
jgi:hypothetical protein